jgi:hypothetical protein
MILHHYKLSNEKSQCDVLPFISCYNFDKLIMLDLHHLNLSY